jgi:hypothetical protein
MKDLKINNGGLIHINGSFIAALPTGNEFKIAFTALLAETEYLYSIEDLDVHTIVPVHNPTVSRQVSTTIIQGLIGAEEGTNWIESQYDAARTAVLEYAKNLQQPTSTAAKEETSTAPSSDKLLTLIQEHLDNLRDNVENRLSDVSENDIELDFDSYNKQIQVNFDTYQLACDIIDMFTECKEAISSEFEELQNEVTTNEQSQA